MTIDEKMDNKTLETKIERYLVRTEIPYLIDFATGEPYRHLDSAAELAEEERELEVALELYKRHQGCSYQLYTSNWNNRSMRGAMRVMCKMSGVESALVYTCNFIKNKYISAKEIKENIVDKKYCTIEQAVELLFKNFKVLDAAELARDLGVEAKIEVLKRALEECKDPKKAKKFSEELGDNAVKIFNSYLDYLPKEECYRGNYSLWEKQVKPE